ncbi:taurine ABC transporter substrate-binding protein [Pseudoclavibacter sp. RFBG4]|uniref:ABC transporter substrate-binding protein n=1 Tax=Pseudoclavibacter sp. RFBG4 TaxID=2080575 RepID=UPI000CE83C25|nr:ABC transporter substrate-binding protein [Pseudoclavibacter sp. RFBG4]PPG35852.1 taurine ABC transporter substrate-binding protein [Pseudoclavibacter sp. RFBG4]
MNTRPTTAGFRSRAVRSVIAAGAVAAVAVLAGCSPSADGNGAGAPAAAAGAGDVTIGLTYTPNIQFVPFYVAEAKGYFDDKGVNVELRHHGEGEDLFGALANGTEDFVYAGGDEITQARAADIPVTSVATLYNTYPATLIVPEDSDIMTAEDARGKTIGTPGPYGQTYFALLSLLQSNGLTADDVKIEYIGYTQQAALTTGAVDGVMGYINNDAVQFEKAGFPVRTIEIAPAEAPTLVGPSLGVADSIIEGDDATITPVLEALALATQDVIDNPEESIDIAAEYIPTLYTDEAKSDALATLEATIPFLSAQEGQPLFTNDADVWATMATFMSDQDLLEKPLDGDAFTNAYVPQS